jgi:histidine triad (HIT) family protein
MENKECIFCKIIRGEIPCDRIYEDKDVLAFLDINPFVKGHLLVIPKKHSRWIWDIEDGDYRTLVEKTKYLANVLRKSFDTDWVEEVIAGIGVEHSQIHLLPRKRDDGLGEIPTRPLESKLSKEEIKEILESIKKNL